VGGLYLEGLIFGILRYFVSFQDVILYHYGEAADDYENELELFENLRKVC